MMAASSAFPMLFTILVMAVLVISASPASGEDFYEESQLSWMLPIRSGCRGMAADCMMAGGAEDEFELDSESSRRILATTRYISYGALQRNTIPCSRRGQSYYNCRPGAPVNPYTRGCSAITRCRS